MTAVPALRVTVVMPVYNAERFVGEAVQSILRQTYRDFDFVIVDDGSTDRSLELVRGFADPRIRLFENSSNLGHVRTLSRCVSLALGPLIARMDADDVASPDRLALQVAFLDDHAAVIGLSGAMRIIDADGRPGQIVSVPTDSDSIRDWLALGRNPLHHPAAMFRRNAFDAVGGYRRAFAPAEDFDLWLRLSERGELANLPEVVLDYRVHSGQLSFIHIEQQELSVAGALLAAQERAAGGSDPFDDADLVDRSVLKHMDADLAGIERRIVERFTIAADAFLGGGHVSAALDAAAGLDAVAFGTRQMARNAAFEADWIRFKSYWARGNPWYAMVSLLRAALRSGKWVGRLVRALCRRVPPMA